MSIQELPFLSYNKGEKGRCLLYLVAFVPMVYKLLSPFFILAGLGNLTIIIVPIMLMLGVIWAWQDIRNSIRLGDIVFYLLIAIFLFASKVIYPSSEIFVEENWATFVFTILPYFFVGLIINYERDKRILLFTARIALFVQVFWITCQILRIVEVNENSEGLLGEHMEQAYMLLFPTFYLFIEADKEHCILDWVCVAVSIFLVFSMATRGPIIILLLFVLAYYLLIKKLKTHGSIKKLGLIIIIYLLYQWSDVIILFFIPIAVGLGFSSRAFDSLLRENSMSLDNSSGRDDIYNYAINAIIGDDGFLGLGWGGDRLITGGFWAHNFELEILVQFGWFMGGFALLLFAILIIKCFIHTHGTETSLFYYVMLFVGLMSLQLSSTYLEQLLLFVFIGYSVSLLRTPIKN